MGWPEKEMLAQNMQNPGHQVGPKITLRDMGGSTELGTNNEVWYRRKFCMWGTSKLNHLKVIIAIVIGFGVSGCSQESAEAMDQMVKPDEQGLASDKEAFGKADAWNERNNPAGLGIEMKTTLAELPLTGQTDKAAWPDTYWPTYKDSTNQRWQSTGDFLRDLSPMEKYDVVFNAWDPNAVKDLRPFAAGECAQDAFDESYYENLGPAAALTSLHKGNLDTRKAMLAGELDEHCNAKEEGECFKACQIEREEGVEETDDERSIRHRCEDRCDRGGVETWWGLCHAWAPAAIMEDEPLYPVTMPTEFGDIVFDIADMKALYSVIYDRSQATLIGGRCNEFDVDRDEQTGRITNDECRDLNAGSFHVSMTNLIGLQKRGFVEDRTFDYEVWNQPVKGYEIHLMQEISISDAHHLLNVTGPVVGESEVPETEKNDCIEGVNLDAGDYCYNTNIDALYEVHASLEWLTESHASTTAEGHENLAHYTRTDRYTYILEVNDGEIVGGEWTGSSRNNHPDFIWLPIGPGSGNWYVDIEKVRMLGRMAQYDPANRPEGLAEEIVTVHAQDTGVDIPDRDPTGIVSTIEVTDPVSVAEAKVSVDITHTYVGDLTIILKGPDGRDHTLHHKEGGPNQNIQKVYSISDVGPINGTWSLHVADHYQRDIGVLNNWKIEFLVGGQDTSNAIELFDGPAVIDIPDNSYDGVASTLNVDSVGAIKKLVLHLDVSHSYIGDLEVRLVKGGISKTVHNREGGSDNDLKRSYAVDEFIGQEASGTWQLVVRDLANHDKGVVNSWSLEITQ